MKSSRLEKLDIAEDQEFSYSKIEERVKREVDLSDSDFDIGDIPMESKRINKKSRNTFRKASKRRTKKSKKTSKQLELSIEDFANKCIRDLKKQMRDQESKKRRQQKNLKVLLSKSRPKISKITVEALPSNN